MTQQAGTDKDRQKEEERLHYVVKTMAKHLETARESFVYRKGEARSARTDFWGDLRYDSEDWFEAAVAITQQAQEWATHARSYEQAARRVRQLEQGVDSPYWGKLVFVEAESGEKDEIYIGTFSFTDEQTGDILVYDWRTPVAGMYYDFGPGPAEYEAPLGLVKGEIERKRQFVIRGGKLLYMFDTGLSIGDDVLQQMLGKNADDKMRSIVTTIQREQNQIIRDTEHRVLIVQGAAGSGKTSAALQRIAYLLYKNRNRWSEDQLLLFSPNELFNDYISNVLPELGEQPLKQTTFQSYMEHRLGRSFHLENSFEQTEALLSQDAGPALSLREAAIAYKASAEFYNALTAYANSLAEAGMKFLDFRVGERVIIPAETLHKRFYEHFQDQPIHSRIAKMREWLLTELKQFTTARMQKYYQKLRSEPKYIGSDEELKAMSRRKVKKAFAPLFAQAEKGSFIDLREIYLGFWADAKHSRQYHPNGELPPGWREIAAFTTADPEGKVKYEDTCPLLLLHETVEGFVALRRMRHVVIDEAQDYSPFQLRFLQRLFPNSGMTLLGDIHQSVLAHSSEEGHLEAQKLFADSSVRTIVLNKSYRSTEEIVHFAKGILPSTEHVEPYRRSGAKPVIVPIPRDSSGEPDVSAYKSIIARMTNNGAESIAILCKTEAECESAYDKLKDFVPVKRITPTTRTFERGILLLPVYLAKGLEFDGVLLYDAGFHRFGREKERRMFYTACTRALHQLVIAYTGEITPFVAGIEPSRYEVRELGRL